MRAYATTGVGTSYGTEVNFTTTPSGSIPAIGQPYLGGILAYLLKPGDLGYDAAVPHGLIAAPSDQSSGAEWGCYNILLSGAGGTAIGTGNQNTIRIMAVCSQSGIAARLCGDLVLNGYDDWYLPSTLEIHELYLNIGPGAPASITNIGGFNYGGYWTSTETSNTSARKKGFDTGNLTTINKSAPFYVRAVRAF